MFSQRKPFQSTVASKRRRKLFRIKIAIVIAFFIFLFGVIFFVTRLERTRILWVYPEGNTFVSDEEIRDVARGGIAGKILFLFPKNNIFYYPDSLIEERVLSLYPEIKTVKVSFRNFQSITVSVSEYSPKALWCLEAQMDEVSCYLVNEEGYIFRKTGESSEGVFVRFFGGVAGDPMRQFILRKDEFKNILLFIDSLEKEEIKITSVSIKDGGVREGRLSPYGTIIWNTDQDLNEAFRNLTALVDNPEFKGKDKNGTLNVEYIDIQNSNKIFYKVK